MPDNKIIYPELSFKIIGIAFKVFNSLQYGHQEKYYQKALVEIAEQMKLVVGEQRFDALPRFIHKSLWLKESNFFIIQYFFRN